MASPAEQILLDKVHAAEEELRKYRERAMREKISILEERVEQLSSEKGIVFSAEWRLTVQEAQLLAAIYLSRSGLITHGQMMEALSSDENGAPRKSVSKNTLAVTLSHLKWKMPGIKIETVWGQGVRLKPESKQWIKDRLP